VKDEEHPALGHEYELSESESTAPTCGKEGIAVYRCKNDNNHVKDEKVPATGKHTYGNGVVTAPTYTSEGYTTYTCLGGCGYSYKDNYVDKLVPEVPDFAFAIREPAVTKLRFMDELVLHADITGEAPEGSFVVWEVVEGAEFFTVMEDNGDGKLRITPKDEGYTTFKATLYAEDGTTVLGTDEVEMFSRAHLFDKIGGIIRYIFGSNIKYEK
jgi:hypothetical protein